MNRPLVLLLLLCVHLPALAYTAGDLLNTCEKSTTAINAKGKFDQKHTDDIYATGQCVGFIQGIFQAMDGEAYTIGSTPYTATIKWSEMPQSMLTIAQALQKHLAATPLDSGKPADIVLLGILREGSLVTMTPFQPNCPEPAKSSSSYRSGD